MRLLFIVHSPRRIGGASRSAARICDALGALGHEVRVCAAADEESEPSPQKQIHDLFTGATLQRATRRAGEEIESWRPDLVVGFYGSQGAFSAVAAARLAGVPAVACLRGNDVNLDFFSAAHHHLVAFAVEKADAVTVVSSDMRRRVARWLGVDATFVANSVDRSLWRPDPEGALRLRAEWGIGAGPVVGLFGEVKPARGLGVLAELEEATRGATVLLVGAVRPESRREVPDWVRTVPYLADRGALCAAYTLCDLVLQPSLDEGMPNTVLEAMACERVVVASRAGGLPDLIRDGENGFLCDRGDWPATVGRLLAEPPAVGAEARRTAPTPRQEAQAFTRVFEGVLERRGGEAARG
jgi:glycosyltransferase involved in cell wall biosynthesis